MTAAELDVDQVDIQGLADEGGMVAREEGVETEEPRLKGRGMTVERRNTTEGVHPYDAIEWEMRTATITNDKSETLFRQDNCEIPKSWTPKTWKCLKTWFWLQPTTP